MTQRQLSGVVLPDCGNGHAARHMLDVRGMSAGGGYFVECQCRHTPRRETAEDAVDSWHDINGLDRPKREPAQRQLPLGNVSQMRFTR